MDGQQANGIPIRVEKHSLQDAQKRDMADPLRHLRDEFIIPSIDELKSDTISSTTSSTPTPSTYLCGNSLGLQPKRASTYITAQLSLWRTKGVYGHFRPVSDSPIPPWLSMDEALAASSARIIGALPSEVAIMQTLTANLHLMLASFYRPTPARYKIVIEGKAFPSDHYVVESQLRHHNLRPDDAMVLIEPASSTTPLLSTSHILAVIDEHADSAALLLLPGVQFYTGQFFDMQKITAHAREKGLVVGWDLAHAVGNVPLHLHDWNVDFAAWCNYKYMNCGPGAIGGVFVHDRHGWTGDAEGASLGNPPNGTPNTTTTDTPPYHPRLSGWWGSSKASRFAMTNVFTPIPGARGYQLSNPSALDMAAAMASLALFDSTSMTALRERSLQLTGYLEELLDAAQGPSDGVADGSTEAEKLWDIITPRDPAQRGAQLSLRLRGGLLEGVMAHLEGEGVVVDERRPDVVRVAPAAMYNSFEDCWRFVDVWREGVRRAVAGGGEGGDKEEAEKEGITKGRP